MFHLVYCSSTIETFSDEDLAALLTQSRERNAREDLTGLLLYHRGSFIQVLEGPEDNVRKVFTSILRDPRHHSLITIIEEPLTEREFPDWQMAFHHIRDTSSLPEGFSDFLSTPFTGKEFSENPARCQKLLLAYKKLL